MTERYCMGCRSWYDPKLRVCPECDTPKPKFNKWLRTSMLNNHLYKDIERAHAER